MLVSRSQNAFIEYSLSRSENRILFCSYFLIQFVIFNICYSIFGAAIEHKLVFLPLIYNGARLDVAFIEY